MSQPTISLIPMHGAIPSDRSITLDVLIKIQAPEVGQPSDRPPLNLGFVLDRSGSMQGRKIDYARQAVTFAVEQLLPSDRLSLTVFDSHVETPIPSTLATDKHHLLETIRRIRPGSSTALHAGWVNGGLQVSQYLNPEHLNRVILLSDGLANVGETNPDVIATDVHGLMQWGVTTTTLGVGADYDETLLEGMARSGDGNFFHIDSPDHLPEIFQTELQGLVGTVGQAVTLALTPLAETRMSDVLNDLEKTSDGRLKLPNLTIANPLYVVVRLQIPALTQGTAVLEVTLNWQAPGQTQGESLSQQLRLEVVAPEQMSDFPAHPEVQEQVALLMAARARQEAVGFADSGNYAGAAAVLRKSAVSLFQAPASPSIESELAAAQLLAGDFETGDKSLARKRAVHQAYHMSRGRGSDYGQKKANPPDKAPGKPTDQPTDQR